MTNRPASLRSLEIFVSVARSVSMTKAADEMGLTISAISRRVRDLELDLGTDLFIRHNRRLELSAAGSQLLLEAGEALDRLQAAADAVRVQRPARSIRISTMPAFASSWLVPKLAKFRAVRPDIETEVATSIGFADFSTGEVQAGIRFGKGHWSDLLADKLLDVDLIPYCDPQAVGEWGEVTSAGLDRFTFLSMANTPDLWEEWLRHVGLPRYVPKRTKLFDSIHVLYETAASGLGLALGIPAFMEDHSRAGRLTAAFDVQPLRSEFAYYLVYRQQEAEWPAFQALRRALLADAAD